MENEALEKNQEAPRTEEMGGKVDLQEEKDLQLLHRHFYSHFRGLEQQAAALQEMYPGLDLKQELKSPLFARLTSPGVGLSVADAYRTVHFRQLQEAAVEAARQQVMGAIATGAARPLENGLNSQAAAVSSFDYRNASRQQREDLKKSIRQAKAQGRKLYPGR